MQAIPTIKTKRTPESLDSLCPPVQVLPPLYCPPPPAHPLPAPSAHPGTQLRNINIIIELFILEKKWTFVFSFFFKADFDVWYSLFKPRPRSPSMLESKVQLTLGEAHPLLYTNSRLLLVNSTFTDKASIAQSLHCEQWNSKHKYLVSNSVAVMRYMAQGTRAGRH